MPTSPLNIPFVPLRDECLVKIIPLSQMDRSQRIWIPDNAEREDFDQYQAIVVSAGKRCTTVKNGDRVLFYWAAAECAPTRKDFGDEEYQIVGEWSIQAILED